jgi:hypothetical protein
MNLVKFTSVPPGLGAKHNLSQPDIVVTRGLNRISVSSLRKVLGTSSSPDVPPKNPASMYLDLGGS